MLIFALGELPNAWYQVLLLPAVFAALGAFIWVSERRAELKHRVKPWKWVAALPFLLSFVYGWGPLTKIRDFFYKEAIQPFGMKMEIAHYAAFMVPVAVVLGLAVWEFIDRTRAAAAEKE